MSDTNSRWHQKNGFMNQFYQTLKAAYSVIKYKEKKTLALQWRALAGIARAKRLKWTASVMGKTDAMHREGQHHFWGIPAKDAQPESY